MTKKILWMPFILLLAVSVVSAQVTQCAPLILESFEEIEDHCSQLGRNQVCYGHDLIDADFAAQNPPEFENPADRVYVMSLEEMRLSALDTEQEEWGIALFNIQADLPETIPGQNVTILAMGDNTVQNDVSADDAQARDSEVIVEATVDSNLRDEPDDASAVMDGVTAGTLLTAYGINADGTWLRVQRETTPLWISREVVTTENEADFATLPVLTDDNYSSMQAFRLSSGIGRVACESITDGVVVQTPRDTEAQLTINGSEIQVGSTVMLTVEEDTMTLYVLDGSATVNETEGIPAGYAVETQLDTDGNAGVWYGFRQMTDADIDRLEIYTNVPESLLHYPITMPVPVTLETEPTAAPSNTGNTAAPADNTGSSDDTTDNNDATSSDDSNTTDTDTNSGSDSDGGSGGSSDTDSGDGDGDSDGGGEED